MSFDDEPRPVQATARDPETGPRSWANGRLFVGLVLITVAVVVVARPAIELHRVASLCAVEVCSGSDGRKLLLSHGTDLHDATMLNRLWLIFIRDLPALGITAVAHRLTAATDGQAQPLAQFVRGALVAVVGLLALAPHVLLRETLDLTTRLTS